MTWWSCGSHTCSSKTLGDLLQMKRCQYLCLISSGGIDEAMMRSGCQSGSRPAGKEPQSWLMTTTFCTFSASNMSTRSWHMPSLSVFFVSTYLASRSLEGMKGVVADCLEERDPRPYRRMFDKKLTVGIRFQWLRIPPDSLGDWGQCKHNQVWRGV